jgi:signal transduction histidine kinase
MGAFGGTTLLEKTFPIDFAGRQWVFEVSPTQGYLARHREENAWVILIAGMLLTTLVGAFILILSGRSNLLQNFVNERTKKLQLSESRLAQAQRIATLGNWDWNPTKHEMWWSDQTYRIFDMEPEASKVTFKSLLDIVHPDDREFLAQTIDTALEERQSFDIDHRILLADCTGKFVNQHGEPIFDDNETTGRMMGTVQDITERQKLSRMQNEFIATVSHELRTPLTSIKGSLGLVANGVLGALPAKAAGLLDIAYRNADRLTYLVNDILDIERIASGNMEFDFQTVDLSALVTEAIENNQGLANQNGVTFVPTDITSQAAIKGDGNRITQVITNLLSNPPSSRPTGSDVEISVTHHGGTARVSVSDHGPGVPESFRQNIFGRFAQADGSNTRESGGTGLGLNISRSIIEKHGGEIDYEFKVDVGSTFYFTLPTLEVIPRSLLQAPA